MAVEQGSNGSDQRVAELYEAHQRLVQTICFSILRNHHDAEDAAQEVFTRAVSGIRGVDNPRAWLRLVAQNHCLDVLRRRRVRAGASMDTEVLATATANPEDMLDDRLALVEAIDGLSGRDRLALVSHMAGYRIGEIAQRLGVGYGAAAQTISRAKQRARLGGGAVLALLAGWGHRSRSLRGTRVDAVATAARSSGASQWHRMAIAAAIGAMAVNVGSFGPARHPVAPPPSVVSTNVSPQLTAPSGGPPPPQAARPLQYRLASSTPAPTVQPSAASRKATPATPPSPSPSNRASCTVVAGQGVCH